ncbi:hypothetical protein DID88_010239 [Monilinia fructigena]|uniref:Uncharacterized protein n=1 Tax=Monilinia fructigena TaxID=38457 RepID=A0A395IM17_9HELO|nr:hypothetical protein DID88_010239 [Monilinia fructigena]
MFWNLLRRRRSVSFREPSHVPKYDPHLERMQRSSLNSIAVGWKRQFWEWRKARAEMLSELERDFIKLSPLQIRFLCHLMHLETSYTTIMASPCRRPEFEFFQRSRWG